MSAAYILTGLLLGTAFARWTIDTPQWMFLLIPAGLAFICGLVMEQSLWEQFLRERK